MYKLKITCNCGAILELEFDRDISKSIGTLYNKFLEAHKNCREYFHIDLDDPLADDSDALNRLDKII